MQDNINIPKIIRPNFDAIWPFLDLRLILKRHFKLTDLSTPKAQELLTKVEELKGQIITENFVQSAALFAKFAAKKQVETLILLNPDQNEVERFIFPRKNNGQSWADNFDEKNLKPLILAVCTTGIGLNTRIDQLNQQGEYVKSHLLAVFALEGADALMDYLNSQIDKDGVLGKAKSQRVSFGYPGCPGLQDQVKLFQLLDVERRIGVKLSSAFMMEPEASVSAVIF